MQPYTPRTAPSYPDPVSAESVAAAFSGAADLVTRRVTGGGIELTVFFLDGLTSGSEIADFVLKPLTELPAMPPEELLRQCADGRVYHAVADVCGDLDAVCRKLVNGFCVVTIPTLDRAVAFEVKTGEKRPPSPPEVENTVKGARDAFTETVRTNTSLVRRHLRTPRLRIWETVVGRKSLTNVSLLSVEGLTDPDLTARMRRRLEAVDVDGFLTPAAVEEYLTGSRRTLFPLLQYTERADRFAQGLLDGQIGVLVDGLPLGYLAPVDLGMLLSSVEDRGQDYISASAVRILRCVALLTSLLLPALYIAMAEFHQAMIPTKLLLAIIQSKELVPFSTVAEVLGLLAAFQILQEAGLHLPQSIGHTVSIIGGLVVGTAAVEADLISPAALIVVAASGICGSALPGQDLTNAVRVWQFALAVCAAVSGLFGLTVAGLCLLVHLGSLESFGRPYLGPFSGGGNLAAILRRRLSAVKFRDPALRTQDRRNQR